MSIRHASKQTSCTSRILLSHYIASDSAFSENAFNFAEDPSDVKAPKIIRTFDGFNLAGQMCDRFFFFLLVNVTEEHIHIKRDVIRIFPTAIPP